MSSNEFINKEEADKLKADEQKKTAKKTKRSSKSSKGGASVAVQIMNGEFLSKDWFINHLPFTFFIGFLLVVLIGWGYYAETVTKHEAKLKEELGELNSEFFSLNSEYITKKGRQQVKVRLAGTGLKENRISPYKIRVKRYVFE